MRRKQGIVERSWNCLWRMVKKPLLFACMICLVVCFLLGTKVKIDFSLHRAKSKIQRSFIAKWLDDVNIWDVVKKLF